MPVALTLTPTARFSVYEPQWPAAGVGSAAAKTEPKAAKAATAAKAAAPPAAAAAAAPAEVDPVIEAHLASLLTVGEECVTEADLRNLLTKKPAFNLYGSACARACLLRACRSTPVCLRG